MQRPGQDADRKETIGVPEQHHEEEHEQDDGKRDAQRGDRASIAIRASRVLFLVDLAREDSMRVCTIATEGLARFRRDSSRPSERRFLRSWQAVSGGRSGVPRRSRQARRFPRPARDSRRRSRRRRALRRAPASAASWPSGPSLSLADSSSPALRARCGSGFPRLADRRAQQRLGVRDESLRSAASFSALTSVFVHKWPFAGDFTDTISPMSRSHTAGAASPKTRMRALGAAFARSRARSGARFERYGRAAAIRVLALAIAILVLWGAANWIVQTVRKPSEIFSRWAVRSRRRAGDLAPVTARSFASIPPP